jgi:hypothetical protein
VTVEKALIVELAVTRESLTAVASAVGFQRGNPSVVAKAKIHPGYGLAVE